MFRCRGEYRVHWGHCILQSTSDTLTIRIEAADKDRLRKIQDLLTADLERFGQRDNLKVTWQQIKSW